MGVLYFFFLLSFNFWLSFVLHHVCKSDIRTWVARAFCKLSSELKPMIAKLLHLLVLLFLGM